MSEKIAFEPCISLPFIIDKDGNKRPQTALAVLRFPDAEIAVSFINTASDPELEPVTPKTMGETTISRRGQGIYDVGAFVLSDEAGVVEARITRHSESDIQARLELSELVTSVTEQMLDKTG